MNNNPEIKVHYGSCNVCRREHILVVHYNYHNYLIGFRLCLQCYKKGQIIKLVESQLLDLEKAEIF